MNTNNHFNYKIRFLFLSGVIFSLILSTLSLTPALAQEDPIETPAASENGLGQFSQTASSMFVVVDPNPAMQGIKIPFEPAHQKAGINPNAATATFQFSYIPSGGTDIFGDVCVTTPTSARTALAAAAAIWAETIQSSVPIRVRVCWSTFSDPLILGGSASYAVANFSGAPQGNTYYRFSLADALHGSDLYPSYYDIYITYSSEFAWYYGSDSNPPAGQYDLITVAAHEIAHGLGFAGTAFYTEGSGGQYGYSDGNPDIYDRYIEDGSGTNITSYTNPSTALGTVIRSNNLWFNGVNANAANGGSRVKIYAPSTWNQGSSYSHLDYSTFAGTINSMMVYAISSGSANHNPGPVTKGLLKDLGWTINTDLYSVFLPILRK